jgi:hypothetical protein
LVVLVLIRVVFSSPGGIASEAAGVLEYLSGYIFGAPVSALLEGTIRIALMLSVPFVIVWLALERGRLPSKSLGLYWRLLGVACRWGWFALRYVWKTMTGAPRDARIGRNRG